MKIFLNRESLLKRLTPAHAILSKKAVIPVTNYALITFKDDNKMFIQTTNMRTSVSVFLPIESFEGELQSFICDTRSIQRIIASLNSETIYIEIDGKSIKFGVEGGRRKVYEIPIEYQIGDFPSNKSFENDCEFNVSGAIFHDIISKLVKFIPRDDTAFPDGFMVEQYEDELSISAVKQICLASVKLKVNSGLTLKLVIPSEISLITELFKDNPELTITIGENGKFTKLSDGSSECLVVNLNSGHKNPLQLINNFNCTSDVSFSRIEASGAIIRTSSLVKDESLERVDFTISSEDIVIKTNDVNYSTNAQESIPFVNNNNCNVEIGFNHKLMSPMISTLGEVVKMEVTDHKSMVRFSDADERGYKLEFILMPMLIMNPKSK